MDLMSRTPPKAATAELDDLPRFAVEVLEQGEPVLVVCGSWRVRFANRSFEKLAQMSREQMLGLTLREIFPESERLDQRYERERARANDAQELISFEHYCASLQLWFHILAYPTSEGLALYFRNITEKEAADHARHESERSFQLLVDSVEEYAIFMLDRDGFVASWNRGAECIKGYKAEEIIGQPYERFFPAEAIENGAPGAALESAAREGHFQDQGWRVRKNGSLFWADATLTAIRDERGEVTGFAKITRDLSARKRREDVLERLESWARSLDASIEVLNEADADSTQPLHTAIALNRAVLENALDAVVGINSNGDVIDWNAQAEKMFGWSRAEAVGQSLCELIVPEPQREAHRKGLQRYLESGQGQILNQRIEVSALHKSAEEFPVELTVTALPTRSTTIFYSFIRDISKEKAIEHERKMLIEELEHNIAVHETFFSVLAHDLRTPLSAILMNSEMLRRKNPKFDVSRAGEQIAASGKRMGRMIEQLLDVSRARVGGGLAIKPQMMDLERVCREVITEVINGHPERIIEFKVLGRCRGKWDGDRLAQVVSNLLSNAVHHGVQESPVHVMLNGTAEDAVELKVENQGVIPPDLIPVLFKPFEQPSRSGESSRGLGLGLYIAHEIVCGHHGNIDVRSNDAEGTIFTVRLPRYSDKVTCPPLV